MNILNVSNFLVSLILHNITKCSRQTVLTADVNIKIIVHIFKLRLYNPFKTVADGTVTANTSCEILWSHAISAVHG